MAPPNFLAGSAFLRLYWSLGGELGVNVLGLQVGAGVVFNQALAETVGTLVKGAASTHLSTLMAPTTSLVRIGLRDFRTPNAVEYRDTAPAATMIGVGDPLPRGTALCLTLRTGLAGKRYTGRCYLSGWTEAQNDATGTQAAGAATGGASFLNAVAVGLPASQLSLAVVSRPSERIVVTKVTYHSDGTTTTEIVSDQSARPGAVNGVAAVESRNSRWEYQRRRDNGRGGAGVGTLTSVVKIPIV